ncbi:MAG: cytochrome c [Bacteroidota bacterium]
MKQFFISIQMKKLSIIAIVIAVIILAQSCSDVQRKPSRVYMPDMAYSVAYKTYADHASRLGDSAFYNAKPVAGTVKRGEDGYHYEILADTTGTYNTSSALKSPLPPMDKGTAVEAERLFLVNCGVCHGPKLDGNGPLYKDGNGPYSAKPANLSGADAKYVAMTEGTMFHSITYGKNMMGSYASQVTPKQRWMIISYIKSKQQAAAAKPADAATATMAPAGKAAMAPAGKDSSGRKAAPVK